MMTDMGIDDEIKLKVVTRFLEGRAETWWESVKARNTTPLTWGDFLREFDDQYYTHFYQKEKQREFLNLVQGGMTVEGYEPKFKELISYVPSLIRNEEDRCSYFEEGLNTAIRERMPISGDESYKKVVQMALQAQKLVGQGHIKNFCPELGRARPATSSLQDRNVNKKGSQSVVQPMASNMTRSGTGSTMSIFQHDLYVLIDSGAEMSFINTKFSQYSDKNLSPLKPEIVVHTPLGEEIVKNTMYKGCSVMIGEKEFMANLIPLEFRDFDVILEMDWLSFHRAMLIVSLKK
ncbi:Retrotransposon gag protein [Corchorus olitorius]|uniref:Retrotransposon gag protein n=1 Tax=Corchorus olitorius TaxID=93759 RepID=A0A1R3HCP4_9ROSI|nr:Retrotransposon gag protein [Corchorus olitorius]